MRKGDVALSPNSGQKAAAACFLRAIFQIQQFATGPQGLFLYQSQFSLLWNIFFKKIFTLIKQRNQKIKNCPDYHNKNQSRHREKSYSIKETSLVRVPTALVTRSQCPSPTWFYSFPCYKAQIKLSFSYAVATLFRNSLTILLFFLQSEFLINKVIHHFL